jgi:hypothetical protein
LSSERNAEHSTEPAEVWKSWNEANTGMWTKAPERRKGIYRDLFRFQRVWMKPALYSMMCFEPWLEAHYQLMEMSLHMARDASLLINAAILPNRWTPTHPDAAQAVKLLAVLEERVYAIEDALVDSGEHDLKMASGQIEKKPGEGLECLSTCQQTEVREDLAGRLERLEGKMDTLLAALAKIEASMSRETFSPGSDLRDKTEKA